MSSCPKGSRGSLSERSDREIRPLERPLPTEVWPWDEGNLGGRPREAPLGTVTHTMAGRWAANAGGGSFIYHLENNQVYVGFVVHLNYENPHLYPYMEFQRFMHHPMVAELLKGGKRVAYGARAISEGGWQSMPKMVAPGVALLGCSVGMVNVPRIKGNHNAMLSGKAAAEAAHAAITAGRHGDELTAYETEVRTGAIGRDLKKVRNVKPLWSKYGLVASLFGGGADMWANTLGFTVLGTLRHGKTDAAATGKRQEFRANRLSEARREAFVRPADERWPSALPTMTRASPRT